MSHVHVVSFCNLIGTTRARWRKSIAFPVDVTRLSPPLFLRREPGDEATNKQRLIELLFHVPINIMPYIPPIE